jgi:hypothetical protein
MFLQALTSLPVVKEHLEQLNVLLAPTSLICPQLEQVFVVYGSGINFTVFCNTVALYTSLCFSWKNFISLNS